MCSSMPRVLMCPRRCFRKHACCRSNCRKAVASARLSKMHWTLFWPLSAVRRWMAPENRSLGALDCLCCCRLVCCPLLHHRTWCRCSTSWFSRFCLLSDRCCRSFTRRSLSSR
ncbi:hypothetical protein BLNAU_9253 [Blattamonas nauphoetae]|uniref:Secreted protein n=1 Tax=Blattamonas nauphoetae TaxID=2049346 RepID=A0ABQ9WZ38_9EUKA|nr:hypothetical protein BLNAU_20366 [Blattamonas nauphoetae]KAK2949566.1 hypothetical protein BLNAU_15548 [Blattamonas nauphoetae]KAK2955717.1 hypothetical protein BLNAU_9253 [Blattamonas nauphoetae]